jgi:hypothetical protein
MGYSPFFHEANIRNQSRANENYQSWSKEASTFSEKGLDSGKLKRDAGTKLVTRTDDPAG